MRPAWDNEAEQHAAAPHLWKQQEDERAIEALKAWSQAHRRIRVARLHQRLVILESELAVSQERGLADVELLARLIRAYREELLLLASGAPPK